MSSDNQQKIVANVIIEVLGKPPEHLVETLNQIADKIDNEKYAKIVDKKINKAKELEKKEGYFTNYMELEIEFNDISNVPIFVFRYMPAHIDIISPEKITLHSGEWNSIFNDITRRMHGYDEVARTMKLEKQILERKLKKMMGQTPEGGETEEKDEE